MMIATPLMPRVAGHRDANGPLHLSMKFAGASRPTHAMCGTPITGSMRTQGTLFRGWFQALCPGCGQAMDAMS